MQRYDINFTLQNFLSFFYSNPLRIHQTFCHQEQSKGASSFSNRMPPGFSNSSYYIYSIITFCPSIMYMPRGSSENLSAVMPSFTITPSTEYNLYLRVLSNIRRMAEGVIAGNKSSHCSLPLSIRILSKAIQIGNDIVTLLRSYNSVLQGYGFIVRI